MMKPNFLLITVDDMNYNSIDFLKDANRKAELMPNMCRMMDEGMTMQNSHVTIALCQPSRSVLLTGKYPHCNGARGFEDIYKNVVTLPQILKADGYYNGIIGKEEHVSPREQFCWDRYERVYNEEHDFGRNPESYYQKTKSFLDEAKAAGSPFFLMMNSHDPHRPFAGSADEKAMFGRELAYDCLFGAEDVTVPAFLPDLPEIRTEFAQYLNSVHRADQTVGRVLQALAEAGQAENTMIMFLSDNGMSMPYAKANCYLNSTKSPYILKWSGHIPPGTVTDALVSGIDYMPTILEIAGLPCPGDVNGKSFLHILQQPQEQQYDDIFTFFYKTANNPVTKRELYFPMRAVQDKQYAYIYNGWHGQEDQYRTETMAGLTFDAMKKAAETDAAIKARVDFYLNRVPEELYDYEADPHALNNLAGQGEYQDMMQQFRQKMAVYMTESKDDLANQYKKEMKMEGVL